MNPVLQKEMRQRFRTFKTPLIISLYLLIIGGLCLGYIYMRWRNMPGFYQPGLSRELLITLSMAQLVLLAFVIPGLTSGSISAERERQTLNVLLVTRLSPLGIVLGKMISSSSFMVLILLATLPLYNIIILYGGFSPGQLLGTFAFYLVTMIAFGAVGIACSSFFKKTGASTVMTYGIVFAIMVGTILLGAFIYEVTKVPGPALPIPVAAQILQDINPPMVLMRLLGEGGMGPTRDLILPYWGFYSLFYLLISVVLIWWSAERLKPGKGKEMTYRQ
ncbi:MAG: ABC transporter permease [Desulfocucumaceae bacterium]